MGIFVIVKDAIVDIKKNVETAASRIKESEVTSLLDACTGTGNCC